MTRQWVIARDHKTNLNEARQYRTEGLTWTDDRTQAHRFTAQERTKEFTWCRQASSSSWDVFYYRDAK